MVQQSDRKSIYRLVVDESAMVQLPLDLRAELGVAEGDYVAFDVVDGTIFLTRSSLNGPA